MDINQIEYIVNSALDQLFKNDYHLLDAEVNERSLTHWLAIYLMQDFSGYDVDCEYNRDGFDIKKLEIPNMHPASDEDIHAVTVYPDIIVHKRGSKNFNLLVIEVKKADSPVPFQHDIVKLKAFKSQLNYDFALHVILGLSNGVLVREIVTI